MLPAIYDPISGPSVIDGMAIFMADGGRTYRHTTLVAPDFRKQPLAARVQDETRFNVRPGSWLLGFTAHSSESDGFDVQITIGKTQLFPRAMPHNALNGAANVPGMTTAKIISYLPAAVIIPPPGVLLVRIHNKAAATNDCEIVLWLATPLELDAGELGKEAA